MQRYCFFLNCANFSPKNFVFSLFFFFLLSLFCVFGSRCRRFTALLSALCVRTIRPSRPAHCLLARIAFGNIHCTVPPARSQCGCNFTSSIVPDGIRFLCPFRPMSSGIKNSRSLCYGYFKFEKRFNTAYRKKTDLRRCRE